MGKKNKGSDLGRSLVKDRFSKKHRVQASDGSMIHSSDLNDGYDWGRLNLQSVTEESSFQEFLSTAELAGTEFEAEKLNLKFVKPTADPGLFKSADEVRSVNKERLRIPRRPHWDKSTTPEELDRAEKESFLEWRRELAIFQEEQGFVLTPYEKNLEFWRQLWRVIERSDVVVQIVDARIPLMFRCHDLETYVKEVSPAKMNVLLINKADFLTDEQREEWARYFTKEKIKVVFFSAVAELPEDNEEAETDVGEELKNMSLDEGEIINSGKVLTSQELVYFFRSCHRGEKVSQNKTTIGLVGYPNVGKSSTLNSLIQTKCVGVSATPGKTKHFQTIPLLEDITLCDCPGLVMPSAVISKSDMILYGVLPIDQLRDHQPPIALVVERIPSCNLAAQYGVILPEETTPENFLNAFAFNRGFMTANGQPDNPRSARYILKDYVCGKLSYCHAPPGVDQKSYHKFPVVESKSLESHANPRYIRAVRGVAVTATDLDKQFFTASSSTVHAKGIRRVLAGSVMSDADAADLVNNHTGKPWKLINKHANKKKKEKLRRVYAELDQH